MNLGGKMNSRNSYAAYNNQLALSRRGREEDVHCNYGLDHSPSCKPVKSCGFSFGKDSEVVGGILEALVRGPVLKLVKCVGAVRQLVAFSKTRRRRKSTDAEKSGELEEVYGMLRKSLSISEASESFGNVEKQGVQAMNMDFMQVELLAVLRHLEVRWQLFNEAMTKWCDLEAMLAFCTDNVTWTGVSGTVISGKNSPLLIENLGSLVTRKLSCNFVIEQVTRLSPKVLPDMCLDGDGNFVDLKDSEVNVAAVALDKLLGSRKSGVYTEDSWYREPGPYMVLEKDWYTLQDARGEIVEKGTRTVLWKQHDSTWYIRACIVTPLEKRS